MNDINRPSMFSLYNNSNVLEWNNSIEILLRNMCDQSKCYTWMHSETYSIYNKKHRIFNVLVNVFSVAGGLTNVISGSSDINGFKLSWLFGSITILFTMSNVIQDKLAYNLLATEHKQFAVLWSLITMKIQNELSLPRENRKDCHTFLKIISSDINSMAIEANIKIPSYIKEKCYEKFKNIENFDIPDICGQIEHTIIYVNSDISSVEV